MRKSGIYKITNLISGKFYIGQSNNLTRRIQEHKRDLKNGTDHNSYLQNAYNSDGGEKNFKFEIINTCSESVLDDCEKFYIFIYKATNRNIGYNRETGGRRKKKVDAETKATLKEKATGRKHTQESIAKMSAAHTGKTTDEETRAKMSESHKVAIVKPESLANLTLNKKALMIKETGEIFETYASAALYFGVKPSMISNHINNPDKFKTVKGYHLIKIT